eukprot:9389799-Pyramimonas_sp.AAC.1
MSSTETCYNYDMHIWGYPRRVITDNAWNTGRNKNAKRNLPPTLRCARSDTIDTQVPHARDHSRTDSLAFRIAVPIQCKLRL